MRIFEENIIRALKCGQDVSLSCRDSVRVRPDNDSVVYILHRSVVAERRRREHTLILGVAGGAWQTNTTKRRINAIALGFNLPTIYQKNFVWYWSDGADYTGPRTFNI